MSHTTSINSIVISDITALRRAIEELKQEGVKCNLLENAIPRAYYADQSGMGRANFVVHLQDAKYDIGLYHNDKLQGYEARTDFFDGSVEKVLGVPSLEGVHADQTRIGKLYQRYAICATEQQAALQGFTTTREEDAVTGAVTLTLMAA